MRDILFKQNHTIILKDKFGNDLSKPFEVEKGQSALKIPLKDGYYQNAKGEKFFIYDGKGELIFEEDCTTEYDFSHLNFHFLNTFLGTNKHHKNADEKDKKLIKSFCELLEKNLNNPNKTIKPPYFAAIENKLFNINKD